MRQARKDGLQIAALPYRRLINGSLEIMLVTSRETGRWVIPKGWPMKGRTDSEAAAQEAYEEAGLSGRICHTPLGTYGYVKRRGNGRLQACTVTVFPLLVRREADEWPEKEQRRRLWASQMHAASCVAEPDLANLMLTLDERMLGALPRGDRREEPALGLATGNRRPLFSFRDATLSWIGDDDEGAGLALAR